MKGEDFKIKVIELVNELPNDFDLGKEVRALVKYVKSQQKEALIQLTQLSQDNGEY